MKPIRKWYFDVQLANDKKINVLKGNLLIGKICISIIIRWSIFKSLCAFNKVFVRIIRWFIPWT